MSDSPDPAISPISPMTPDDDATVQLERVLPGPIERVWEHLTSPEHLADWLAADDGVVTHEEPPRRLSYTWNDDSEVTLELEPLGEDVRLLLTHRRAATTRALALAA